MLNDYWKSATTAIASINENISTALESLDKDSDASPKSATTATKRKSSFILSSLTRSEDSEEYSKSQHSQVSTSSVHIDKLKDELELYKRMLEEAQMQHVQLSKELGSIIASKDAELSILKGGWHDSFHGSSTMSANIDQNIALASAASTDQQDFIKLTQEKLALENTLKEFEVKYQQSLKASNESNLLSGKYELLTQRYSELELEYEKYRNHTDSIIKEKMEEIDNLAMEYSKLAADSEIRQANDLRKLEDVLRDNQELSNTVENFEVGVKQLVLKIDDILTNPNPKSFAERLVDSFMD